MDYRSNKILNMLIYQKRADVGELADMFGISERMIRKTVKELNDDLKRNRLPYIMNLPDNSICLTDQSKQEVEKIRNFILENNFYTYRLTPNERKTILAMLLLNAESFSTAEELSEYLKISRNTTINDLKELKAWFTKNELELKSYVQKGYIVDGDELKVRKGILKLIELNMNNQGHASGQIDEVFYYLLLEILKYGERAEQIMEIVKEEEKDKNIHFSDFSFIEVTNEILILTERLSKHKYLNVDIGNNIVNSSKYPLSDGILSKIEKIFDIYVPDIEKKYFVRCLRRKSYLQSSTQNVDEMAIPFMIGESIYRIADYFGLNFYLDFALYDVLVDHMKSAIYRIRNNEFLSNPFAAEVEESYPEIFAVVRECVKPIEQYVGNEFKKDEIAFLVMYFASMKEKDRLEKNKNRKVSVILVGDMGRGTMQLMEARLESLNDVLDILGVKSAHEARYITKEDADMVISTAKYSNENILCIRVESPLLKPAELSEIRAMAIRVLNQKEHDEKDKLTEHIEEQLELKEIDHSFISRERILFDAEAADWEEAVRISGRLLYDTGMIEEAYIQSMVDNIKVNGSYIVICKGLAIPHGDIDKGVIQEAASVVRLKTPVYFGNEENDPVHYVVGLSICRSDNINLMIYNLVRMFTNRNFLDKINQARSPDELFDLIKNMI